MDIQFESSYIWATAHYLVMKKGYQLLQIQNNEDKNNLETKPVIHLIKKNGKEYRYIRLALVDFMWSSVVERNVKEIAAMTDLFRKKLRSGKMEALNLYFFSNTPMADIKHRIEEFGRVRIGESTYLQSIWVDLENSASMEKGSNFANFQFSKDELLRLLQQEPNSSEFYIEDLVQTEYQRAKEVKRFFFNAKPLWTYILIGINLFLYLLLTLNGGSTNSETLIAFGAKVNFLIIEGEWWRLITAMFLHIGFLHLAFNSVALYYLGNAVERMYGSARFLWIYFASGILGSVASFYFNFSLSAGASGAIYGLFGALLYFGYRRKDLFLQGFGKDIITILVLNIIISIMVPGIDLYGHLGGLVGGFLAAGVVGLPQITKKLLQQVGMTLLLLALIIGGGYFGKSKWSQSFEYNLYSIFELFNAKEYAAAEKLLTDLIADGKMDRDLLYYYLGLSYFEQDEIEAGKASMEKALEINPKFTQAYIKLANYEMERGNLEEARHYIEKVLAYNPKNNEAIILLELINVEEERK